jgi:hypothetical protein
MSTYLLKWKKLAEDYFPWLYIILENFKNFKKCLWNNITMTFYITKKYINIQTFLFQSYVKL